MQNSVQDILERRGRSRFFGRGCCIPEKTSRVFLYVVIAGALGLYAYLQIKDVVDSYANPVTNRKEVKQDSVALPGLLLCMPSNDVTLASSFSAPRANQIYANPRQMLDPLVVTNIPAFLGTRVHFDCCLTAAQDFFTSCFTQALKCPVPTRMLRRQTTTFGAWTISFDCIKVDPGLTFRTAADSLWLPYFLSQDTGILAWDLATPRNNSRFGDPKLDAAWLFYMDQYVYWPNKLVFFSYIASENLTNPVDIFYGKFDSNVGGFQNRIRCDTLYGTGSLTFQRYISYDIDGKLVASQTGWSYVYNAMYDAIPWTLNTSRFNPTRNYIQTLGWLRVQVLMEEVQSRTATRLSFLDLATTIFSIIGSGFALTYILIGPGEYDPKGILNKLFYYDVPTLKAANTDYAQVVGEKKKGDEDDDDDDDESNQSGDSDDE